MWIEAGLGGDHTYENGLEPSKLRIGKVATIDWNEISVLVS